jgi:UDP-N-acetylmuramoyl-tripeptide--D-alanyl-D-alanine ligase
MATPIPSNQCRFTLAEVAQAVGGLPATAPQVTTIGVAIDSRAIKGGELFVALRGENHDGHAFLNDVAARGAAAAVVERGRGSRGFACIEVEDTLTALGKLASYHLARTRRKSVLRVIAIGGSAGKTTTKELTAAAARTRFGPTLATPGNLNNLVGVPMTIFLLTDEHRAAVFECGTNRRGEVARLGRIIQPDVAVVLNADIEHSAGLGGIEEIADEEASLFKHAKVAVFSPDEPLLMERVPAQIPHFTFGCSVDADVRYERSPSGAITLSVSRRLAQLDDGRTIPLRMRVPGPIAAINAAAALAAVMAAEPETISSEELTRCARSLEKVESVSGRLGCRQVAGVTIIDDTYNANPRSVRIALMTAAELAQAQGARLIVALGDMLELGEFAAEAHRAAVRDVAAANAAILIAVGPEMLAACDELATIAGDPGIVATAADSERAAAAAVEMVRPGDVVLVKGSRGMKMERIVSALEQSGRYK